MTIILDRKTGIAMIGKRISIGFLVFLLSMNCFAESDLMKDWRKDFGPVTTDKNLKPTADSRPSEKPKRTSVSECIQKGINYYKDLGSYPYLSTGESAEKTSQEKCFNTSKEFDGL